MKLAFFETETWEEKYLKTLLPTHNLSFFPTPLNDEHINSVKDCDIISVFIYSHLSGEILAKLPNLKLLATRSTGYDHIDLKYCQSHKIIVCNVPTYGENTVAEHAFALILALARNIVPAVNRTKKGDFSLENLRGMDLSGKTLGVIGVGHIGSHMLTIGKGFGMNILEYSSHSKLTLDEVVSQSDIVSLHLPLTSETKHIINKDTILKFKKGSLLINTARGGLIETEALLLGLQNGILAGVGLDVLEEEALIKEDHQLLTKTHWDSTQLKEDLLNHVLLTYDNVLITPHIAFDTTEALQRILQVTADNIQGFITGHENNQINSE